MYEELGVDRTASADEITKAFRRKAQQCHPDRDGGSTEAFQALANAYAVLGDGARRLHYDETGRTDAEDLTESAITLLSQMVATIVENADIDTTDVIGVMRAQVSGKTNVLQSQIASMRVLIRKYEQAIKRTRYTGNGVNLVVETLKARVQSTTQSIAANEKAIELGDVMMKMLYEYGYEIEYGSHFTARWTLLSNAILNGDSNV